MLASDSSGATIFEVPSDAVRAQAVASRAGRSSRRRDTVEWLGGAGVWLLGATALVWSAIVLIDVGDLLVHGAPLVALGLIATWRYGWGLVHLTRALLYLGVVFPRLKRRAEAVDAPAAIRHVYCIVCSFGIPERQFRDVYTALVANCLESGMSATIIASITSDRDLAILGEVLRRFGDPASVTVIAQFQQGTGKRGAIAMALRTVAREQPNPNSATVMLDGDVVLQRGALEQCTRFLAADPGLAALTSNNDARFAADDATCHWYWLRFAQRHLVMSSLSLSGRLLVLTGRFSVYRTSYLLGDDALAAIEDDFVDHWLHGRIRLLSGDDKSLWQHVLSRGGRMLYLPHVKATSFEGLPAGTGFFGGSTRLMTRWLGNMVRANGRALGLGPRRCGPFLWWCLLDQRLSVATVLFGVSTVLVLGAFGNPAYLLAYLAWLVVSRGLVSSSYGLLWGRYHPSWPALLAYNQIWGGVLKLYLFFRPDTQRWTRQNIRRDSSTPVRRLAANMLCGLSMAVLLVLAASITTVLTGA